ncbi:hypothetical protein CASFOL_039056 [Castilleja foliolosa]|uniref:Uncharacterized protein n=1 Tax=Castilleja foliolosa TaxID=1961234 RepID=A0ABD3BH99_9LAMI
MELKRSLSSSNLSSASASSDSKRRATTTEDFPTEDSPIGQLFNDVSIHVLLREVKHLSEFVQYGKEFLISLQGLVNNSTTKESAKIIYDKALHVWKFELCLIGACTYTIDQEPSLSDKLIFYSNDDTPVQRMDSMKKDPWLKYILGDSVLGLQNSDAFIRGFLSIIIVYWNMKDLLDSSKLGMYGRPRPTVYIPPVNEKFVRIRYMIYHVEDFQNLKEVLESKYGSSDPALAASLFEQISKFQVNSSKCGTAGLIEIVLCIEEGSSPPYPARSFTFMPLFMK